MSEETTSQDTGQDNTNTEDQGKPQEEKSESKEVESKEPAAAAVEGEESEIEGEESEKKPEKGEEDGAPESYGDFEMPENYALDEGLLGELTGFAKEQNLTKTQAQSLVDLGVKQAQLIQQKSDAAWAETRENWVNAIKKDKEFGGEKFNETVDRSNRVLRKYGSTELAKYLQNGLGDYPELIKMLARIDTAMSEDTHVDGRPASGKERSRAQVIYGDTHN